MMTCYDDAVRTIIDLPGGQLEALDRICRRESISRAEAIRRAVDLLVKERAAVVSPLAFGLWRDRPAEDGLQYQQRLRQEWGASPVKPNRRAPRKRPR